MGPLFAYGGKTKGLNLEKYGGERGIRTPGRFPVNGFQDRRFRPLSQLSVTCLHAHRVTAQKRHYKKGFFILEDGLIYPHFRQGGQ